ncbi:Inner membrane protein YcdZ [Klebsiella pneumoniae IS53]|nr:Inner membrane protein YcdZ [Klebsiella pneumoniae IS22]CDL23201.1 Inner membrane protein YcdZ [Klebsiella pneumoniae IS53]
MIPSLALGLVFGYAMKNSGLWLAARADKHKLFVNDNA